MLKDLCAEARCLREIILRRIAAVGCPIDKELLSEAETIVDGKICEFLFASEYVGARRRLADGHQGDGPAMTLLVLECAAMLGVERRSRHGEARATE